MRKRVGIHSVDALVYVDTHLDKDYIGTEYYGNVGVTLPSDIWISTDDAREFARRLIAAADETDNFSEEGENA